jgi:hypothetical protein
MGDTVELDGANGSINVPAATAQEIIDLAQTLPPDQAAAYVNQTAQAVNAQIAQNNAPSPSFADDLSAGWSQVKADLPSTASLLGGSTILIVILVLILLIMGKIEGIGL